MNLRQLMDRYRNDTLDNAEPPFISDEELIDYINEAEVEACRRALLLVDSTSQLAEMAVPAGALGVDLDERIIYVRRARLASRGRPLAFRVVRAMDEENPGWEGAMASVPVAAVPDWQTNYLRFWPPSQAADTLKTTVVRTPTNPMSDDEDVPEIPSRYHVHLLKWVKHLAYSKQDCDMFDPGKAQQFDDQFTAEFGPPRAAIDEHWAEEQYYDVGAN